MIRVQCPHCARVFTVPDEQATKAGTCPGCRRPILIPPAAASVSTAISGDFLAPPPAPAQTDRAHALEEGRPSRSPVPRSDALDRQLLNLPPAAPAARLSDDEVLAKLKFKPPPEYTGVRQLPWPIDIPLYPVDGAGLTNLALVVGIPLLLTLLQRLVFLPFLGLMFLLAKVAVGIYAAWYWAECARDSALGGTRAPQILDAAGYGDKWSRFTYLLAAYLVFVLPAVVYLRATGRTDVFFWSFVAWGVVFFPMGLLAVVVNDALYVLNPLFLLASIRRTALPYLGLLLLIGAVAALFWFTVGVRMRGESLMWSAVVGPLLAAYLTLILAHLFGRFYWHYQQRLDWGV